MAQTKQRTAAEIVLKIKRLDKYSDRINAKIKAKRQEYLDELLKADDDAYDWIPVKAAAILRGVTPQAIYSRKDLEKKYFGSSISVRRSQVLAIDDKYNS